MATTYDKASLVMIPSGYKDDKLYSIKPTDGSGDFTFSRDGAGASPATRVNASGLIEKGRENVLTYSNTFSNAVWANNSGACTRTSGQADKDGGSDAWLITQSAAGFANILHNSSAVSGVYAFSVYAKASTGNTNFTLRASNTTSRVEFNLTSGSVAFSSGVIDSSIEDAGSGFYRCVMIVNATTDQFQIYPQWNSVSAESVIVQSAQLEQGLIATDVITTTTAPVSAGLLGDMPRLDYSGGATCPSLLLEPSRVNSVPFSEYYGGSAWTKANVALTDNSAISPEGVTNAAKLAENASGNNLYAVYEQFTPSLGTYTFSGFMKKGTLRYGGIRAIVNAGANRFFVNADLETGVIVDTDVVGTGVTWSYDIEDYGNGWYRLWISGAHSIAGFIDLSYALSDSATPTYTSALPTYSASGSDYNYIYGAQIESGSYPTSYIPTYGSASTRGADVVTELTSVSSLIGQTEGTLFIHTDSFLSGVTSGNRKAYFYLSDGTFNNRIELSKRGGTTTGLADDIAIRISVGGVTQFDQTIAQDFSGELKLAFAYKNGDVAAYINGSSVYTNTGSVSIPATSEITIGNGYNEPLREPVKQALLFKTRLTNAELAALTTL